MIERTLTMTSFIDLGLGEKPKLFIEELQLKTNIINRLKRQNIYHINTLLGFTKDEIRKLSTIQPVEAEQIIEQIDQWSDKQEQVNRDRPYYSNQSERNPSIQLRHPNIDKKYYHHPIDIIELTERTYNALRANHIETLEQLITYSYRDLTKLDGIGIQTNIDIVDGITYLERGRINPHYITVKEPNSIEDPALGLNFTQRTINALNEHFYTVLARRRRINERSDSRSKDVVHQQWNYPQDITIKDLLNIDIKTFMSRRGVGQQTARNLTQTLYIWCLEHDIEPVGFKVFEYDVYHNGVQEYLKEHLISVQLPNGVFIKKKPSFHLTASPINMKRQRQLLIHIEHRGHTYNVAHGDECYIGYPRIYKLQIKE